MTDDLEEIYELTRQANRVRKSGNRQTAHSAKARPVYKIYKGRGRKIKPSLATKPLKLEE